MKPTFCSSISCGLTEQVPADSHRWLHLWPRDHVLLLINSTSVTIVMSSFTPQLGGNLKVSHRPPCVYLIDQKPKWMKSGLEKSLSRVTFQALSPVVTSRLSVSAPVTVMNKWKPLWCQSVCGSPSRVFFFKAKEQLQVCLIRQRSTVTLRAAEGSSSFFYSGGRNEK